MSLAKGLIEDLQNQLHYTPGKGGGSVAELSRIKQLMSAYEQKVQYSGIAKWFVADGPYNIDACYKQKQCMQAGKKYRQRLFSLSNRSGKSIWGAFETAVHATGLYPEWWDGIRFDKPVAIWCCAHRKSTVISIVQKELLGRVGSFGTGMLPKDSIIATAAWQGMSGGVSSIQVRHVSGGVSVIGLKAYEQGLKEFVGTDIHFIWNDEEPPIDVYGEQLIRLFSTNGSMLVTNTPIHGLTPFILDFEKRADLMEGSERAVAPDEDTPADTSRVVIRGGWDDIPFITAAQKEEYLRECEPHLRAARSKGIPALGSGSVYDLPWEEISCQFREIPKNWRRWYAMDVGWNNTACLDFAEDPNDNMIYAYSEYKQGKEEPAIHALRIKEKGDWIPGIIDPAARQRSQKDGSQLMQIYIEHGLKLIPADNRVESGIYSVREMLASGRLKIFDNLQKLKAEYLTYVRDMDGRIVKENDHLLDCLRYGIVSGINIGQTPPTKGAGNAGYAPRRYFN